MKKYKVTIDDKTFILKVKDSHNYVAIKGLFFINEGRINASSISQFPKYDGVYKLEDKLFISAVRLDPKKNGSLGHIQAEKLIPGNSKHLPGGISMGINWNNNFYDESTYPTQARKYKSQLASQTKNYLTRG